MMDAPELLFPRGLDQRIEYEAEMKGYWAGVTVRLPSGRLYSACFYETVNFSQNLKIVEEGGGVCIGESGLIVIPKVTPHYMREAVKRLFQEGYFDHFVQLQ
jgi:hypothetical protein